MVKFYFVAICDMAVGKQWELLIGLISLSSGMPDVSDYARAPQELVFTGALPPPETILDPEANSLKFHGNMHGTEKEKKDKKKIIKQFIVQLRRCRSYRLLEKSTWAAHQWIC